MARKEGYPLKPTEREKRLLDSLQKLVNQGNENQGHRFGSEQWQQELEEAQALLKEFGR